MALNDQITGSVTGKIKFTIDKSSWNNLDKFQKKLTSVKKQMAGLNRTININAVVRTVEKVAKVTSNAEAAMAKAKVKAIDDVSRAEERAYQKRKRQVLGNLEKSRNDRRKRKSKQYSSDEAFRSSVDAFMEVKYSQIRKEAIRKGYANTQLEQDNLARVKAAADQNFRDNFGNIKQFRSNVNTVVGEMLTMERTARMNRVTFASLRGELVQLTAAYGAFAVAQNVASTGMRLEGIRAAAKVFTGDEAGTREHMAYLVAMSDRLGVNFMVAAQEFNKFSIAVGSKANKGTQRHIFEALSEYATVLQVDQQQYERAIRSVVQIECCLPTQ